MSNAPILLNKFRVSGQDLRANDEIEKAYDDYCDKRQEFGNSLRAFNERLKHLQETLDGPLREAGLIPEGKGWTLKEDDETDGLCIFVWSEPKQRGRRKPQAPFQKVSFKAA